ncbi:transporter substrate-binding domain-containing protein [Verticiella sediminum]|uniref:Transporter substrate-binding domain-containing protein n=1 Tax=Verticiella sediminum TaxID=1247510 RepID=A0A556A7D0_9BURK|nr:transporter substrate-binding domain-containing protein [Verticiella sediminum]TSH88797.1 transporter substrate-binding domain-containing protein [Verticiella sediminum]
MYATKLLCTALLGLALSSQALAASCTPKVAAEDLVQPGKLTMVTNPTLPPQQFVDEKGELQGLNIELGRAVAQKLCLEPVYIRMDRPPMVPALQAGRFDMINTGLFWTEDRAKIMYMVPYGQQAMSIFTTPNSPLTITRFEDLAGRVVGIESGTYQEAQARHFNDEMTKNGLKTIDFRTFTNASETMAALRAGQLEAAINADETALAYQDLGVAKVHLQGLYGTDVTLALRNRAAAEAVAGALDEIKADGFYDTVFDKFRMTRLVDTSKFAIRGPGPDGGKPN